MAKATMARNTKYYKDHQKPKDDKAKAKRVAIETVKSNMSEKTFADLTGPEKDDLLKVLAIQAGFIVE